jgi:hypothetical protein
MTVYDVEGMPEPYRSRCATLNEMTARNNELRELIMLMKRRFDATGKGYRRLLVLYATWMRGMEESMRMTIELEELVRGE